MVFPDLYPSPPKPHAFIPGPLPVILDDVDSMARWARIAGYFQPELDGINFDFEDLDALIPWEQGEMLPAPTLELGGGLVSVFTPVMT